MNNKFIVMDATDDIVIGGFGNLEGNLGLLKYNKEDIRKMITENNDGNDNIRLINSLLQSLKELQEQLQQKEDIINKVREKLQRGITFCENDSQGIHNKCNIAINREKKVLEILDNKGE